MPFIKIQNLRKNSEGTIEGGTASIIDVTYVAGKKPHSQQKPREALGKVIWLAENRRSGIFRSKERGLVAYDADSDEFSTVDSTDKRVPKELWVRPKVHTVFGDAYLFLSFLEKHGYVGLLRSVFPKDSDFERVLMHVYHGVMRTGSKVHCGDFISKSFASYLAPDIVASTLYPDTQFFDLLGDDDLKVAFFKGFVDFKRKSDPSFGSACYVDSTPLPSDIQDNPFNAFCSHGTGSSENQSRLVLIVDSKTGLPLWFKIIRGNILDLSTIIGVVDDVKISLGISITSLVLDAGYASKELITSFSDNRRTLLVKMPLKMGWPHRELYWKHHDKFARGKYAFVRAGHEYFGIHDERELFGKKMHFYIYVDHNNAVTAARKFITENPQKFKEMKDRDKDWIMVKGGFFILISNRKKTPEQVLDDYFGRAEIESVFKTAKTYLALLPLSKWNEQRIFGKMLYDSMNLIFHLEMLKANKDKELSSVEIAGYTQSLMCAIDNDGDTIRVDTPSKQTRQAFKTYSLKVPASLKLSDFKALFGFSPSDNTA